MTHRYLFALLVLTFVIFLSLPLHAAAQGTTFEAAKDKAAPLFGNDPSVKSLPRPVRAGDYEYYLFYYPISSPNRIFAAVSTGGSLETSQTALTVLGNFVYRYDLLYSVLTSYGLSVSEKDRQNSIPDFLSRSTSNIASARSVLAQLEAQYPTINFGRLDLTLESASSSLAGLDASVKESDAAKTAFESDGAFESFNDYYKGYNATLKLAATYVAAAEAHADAVTQKALEIGKNPGLTGEQKEALRKSLTTVADLGAYATFKTTRLNPGLSALSNYEALQSDWVKQSADGFYYRKAKIDAVGNYNDLSQTVPLLLSRKAPYAQCGVSLTTLDSTWKAAQADLKKDTAADYQAALAKFVQIDALVSDANAKYDQCLSTPLTSRKPSSKTDTSWIYLAVLAGIGIGLYALYLRNKHAQELEGQQ